MVSRFYQLESSTRHLNLEVSIKKTKVMSMQLSTSRHDSGGVQFFRAVVSELQYSVWSYIFLLEKTFGSLGDSLNHSVFFSRYFCLNKTQRIILYTNKNSESCTWLNTAFTKVECTIVS